MEIIDPEQKQNYESRRNSEMEPVSNNSGRIIGGIIIIAIGFFLLARKFGFYIPSWIMSWQMLLISIGLLIGAKNSFRPGGWMIVVLVGGVFMFDKIIPNINIKPYIWPIMLILIGMFLIVVPSNRTRGSFRKKKRRFRNMSEEELGDDIIDSTTVFGGTKKNVISKNFKGGEISVVFGGAELNLSQADIQGRVHLEVNQVFGGTKLIVPSNWTVITELTAILGSVEDSRGALNKNLDPDKVLVVDGTSVFGGIEIKSW